MGAGAGGGWVRLQLQTAPQLLRYIVTEKMVKTVPTYRSVRHHYQYTQDNRIANLIVVLLVAIMIIMMSLRGRGWWRVGEAAAADCPAVATVYSNGKMVKTVPTYRSVRHR
ncbi:hypothetical protein ACFLT3_01150 [Chloroflexota bacterium]